MALPLVVHLALTAQAVTITVGPNGDHDNIADAVDEARNGDRIEVDADTYTEDPITVSRDIEIVGLSGSATTEWTSSIGQPVLRIESGAQVTIEGFTMRARGFATAIRAQDAEVTLRDVRVDGNRAVRTADGSALYAEDSTVVIELSAFVDNSAPDGRGGHLYVTGGSLTVSDTTFETGDAGRGGAVSLDDVTATFTTCTFTENTALDGGAVSAVDGDVTFTSSVFERNVCDGLDGFPPATAGDGGALAFDGAVSFTISDGTFTGNVAAVTGGAIRIDGGARGDIDASRLDDNTADFGGAIYLGGTADLEVRGSYLANNQALDGNGGAIRVRSEGSGVELTLSGSQFVGNSATEFGGAVATTSISGAGPDVVIETSEFTGNSAVDGGALSVANSIGVDVNSTLFCANRADGDGGAARVANLEGQRWTNVVVTENRADGSGGGLFLDGGQADILNATFLGDSAPQGGALQLQGAAVRIENTLVAYTVEGDGVAGSSEDAIVAYSDFWENVDSDFPPAMAGVGNLVADPLLEDFSPDGDCANDRYWPTVGSPLVDAGSPEVEDLDGSPSDIGAYGGPAAQWPELVDEDGDDAFATVDCDDTDPTVRPGADETCDGVDQDCDGAIDDAPVDGSTWWNDGDGDGFGGEGPATACEVPADSAPVGGDCDDDDANANPGALERCDGVDNDCDGGIDEEGSGYWPDRDGDGFGDRDAEPVDQCPEDGFVADGTDCDDDDASVFPLADDPAGDGIDGNCDGADGAVGVEDTKLVATGGCGCSGTAGGPLAGPVGLVLLGLARRRRSGRFA